MIHESSSEVYWMLLSFMVQNPEEQLNHLGEVPRRCDPRALTPGSNPLLALNLALDAYFVAWWDDFYPKIEAADRFNDARCVLGVIHGSDPGIFCYEEFVSGDGWRKLRKLALAALEESGLDQCPVPSPIPFEELVELVDPGASAT